MAQAAANTADAVAGRGADNIEVRLRIMAELGKAHAEGDSQDPQETYRFFSQTRVLYWQSPAAGAGSAQMRQLEQATVAFARAKGFNLDLPPVGASPSATYSAVQAPPEPTYSPEGLLNSTLAADQKAQSLWSEVRNRPMRPGGVDGRARQDLVGVAESINGLRTALENGRPSSTNFGAVASNRARLLFSHSQLSDSADIQSKVTALLRDLDVVVAAYRQVGQP